MMAQNTLFWSEFIVFHLLWPTLSRNKQNIQINICPLLIFDVREYYFNWMESGCSELKISLRNATLCIRSTSCFSPLLMTPISETEKLLEFRSINSENFRAKISCAFLPVFSYSSVVQNVCCYNQSHRMPEGTSSYLLELIDVILFT